MKLSSLLNRFNEPETLKMAKLGRALRAQGYDITDLSLGEPDFDTPQHIKLAAKAAIDENFSHYTPVPGYLDVRDAVCQKLAVENNLTYKSEQIVLSTGGKQSIANAVLALVEAGDEVIIPKPYWVTYSALVEMSGATIQYIETTYESNFKITPQQLQAAINDKTKLFIFSSPCNPSGSFYSKDELEALANIFAQHPNIYIISDEIYEYINYVGKHESIAQFENIKNNVIVINGLSKGFAMTGWRLGYMAANETIAKACDKIQGQITSATCSITQRATIAALLGTKEPTKQMVSAFAERRTLILKLLSKIPGLKTSVPDGAFYVFPDVSYYFGKKSPLDEPIHTSEDLAMYLLNSAHVSTVAGSAFGAANNLRISFANSAANIEKGINKIADALQKLQ